MEITGFHAFSRNLNAGKYQLPPKCNVCALYRVADGWYGITGCGTYWFKDPTLGSLAHSDASYRWRVVVLSSTLAWPGKTRTQAAHPLFTWFLALDQTARQE